MSGDVEGRRKARLASTSRAEPPRHVPKLQSSVRRTPAILVIFVGVVVFLTAATDNFATKANLLNVLDQAAPVGIIAAGTTLVIVGGGFDLSTGAVFAVSGIAAAFVANEVGTGAAVPAAIILGLVLGAGNGLIVTSLRVHSFLATLATGLVIRGAGLLFVGAGLVLVQKEGFRSISRESVLGVRSAVFISLGFILICGLLLSFTRFGQAVFAVGGNSEGARVAGLRVGFVRVATFAISGIGAGLAGVIGASRVAGGQIGSGSGLEFTAITAIVLGGTSIFGGEGAMWRTVVGVLLLVMIGNGFNLSNIDPVYQQVVVGGILLTVIALDARARGMR